MASRDPDLRCRESALATRADALRAWELRLRACESELTARRARWGAAWRAALVPGRALELILGLWLGLGATILGGTVLVLSAAVCGVVLAALAVRRMSLPSGVRPPRRGAFYRVRARLLR